MTVTYNKINWDEETPITVANLDRIDVGIDEVVTQSNSNENKLNTIQGSETEVDGRITTNENDISNIEDGTTSVGNALALQGESLEVIAEGVRSVPENSTFSASLLDATEHHKYIFSVYATQGDVYQGYDETENYAIINKKPDSSSKDFLRIVNRGFERDFHYKVWVLR